MRPLLFTCIVLTASLPHAIAWQLPCHASRRARSAAPLPHWSKASPRLRRTTLAVFAASSASSGQRARGRGGRGGRSKRGGRGEGKNALKGLWRVFNVEVPASEDAGKDSVAVTGTVVDKLEGKLGVAPGTIRADAVTTVRKSFDARRDRRKVKQEPHFQYVLDVDFGAATGVRLKPEPGKLERSAGDAASPYDTATAPPRLPVAIVGAGPAGLFCALHLAEAGVPCAVYERGQPVEERGRDIGAMLHRRLLHPESNICYGEGGAGTWSDGKLTTRIGRNSGQVRRVLQELVRFGAPSEILVLGKPHLGTDRLVRILKSLRQHLEDKGVVFHFGTRVEDVTVDPAAGALTSITVRQTQHASIRDSFAQDAATRASFVAADALDAVVVPVAQVVMAAGHSARELFDCLASKPATARALRMAPFAVGFRIEHPQESINALQLGAEWSQRVQRGAGDIPVADYRLATEIPYPVPAGRDREPFERGGVKAVLSDGWGGAAEGAGGGEGGGGGGPGLTAGEGGGAEGVEQRGGKERGRPVYSFCMCPGGQIMCTSVLPDELCVNGMSFSRRQSKWANSALVSTINLSEDFLEPYAEEARRQPHGNEALAGLLFQRAMEQEACRRGGGDLVCPVQRVTDFMAGVPSTDAPDFPQSSYRLGVKPTSLHDLYPPPITEAIRQALREFDRRLPGFISDQALLHGVETRTSSAVRVSRDPATLECEGVPGLFPCGEGAGYAGGIVSAAVDGLKVAQSLIRSLDAAAAATAESSADCPRG